MLATTQTQGAFLPSMVALCVAACGIAAALPLLIAALTDYLSPRLAGIGIPSITSFAILGGAIAPAVTGYLKTSTGSDIPSIYMVSAALLCAMLIAVLFWRKRVLA